MNGLRESELKLFVLTGDHSAAANALANELALSTTQVRSNMSPEQKAQWIEETNKSETVAYVGDGINDCLALAKSHLALSKGGSPKATFKSSDVHILDEDLNGISKLTRLADITYSVVKSSLGLSLTYNVVFGALAVSGLINPFLAAVLMPISSITVVGLTLFRMPTDKPLARNTL